MTNDKLALLTPLLLSLAASVACSDDDPARGTGDSGTGADGGVQYNPGTGDATGGPCSDGDPDTQCATGAGDTGDDPACSDGDLATPCSDQQHVAGDGGIPGGGDLGDGGPIGCGMTPFESDAVPVNLMVVVDASGSMADATVADANTTRWEALSTAVDAALGDVQGDIAMGLQLYPTAGTSCDVADDTNIDVPVTEGTVSHPLIVGAMSARGPEGGTPTSAALARARRYFTEGGGMNLSGDRVVLLATDGGPNCNDSITCGVDSCIPNLAKAERCNADLGEVANCCDETIDPRLALSCLDDDRTIAEVEALAAAGIRTLVIGIPGSEIFRDVLEAMAVAGGGADGYFEVDASQDVSALTALLRGITVGLITSCKLQLDGTPPDLDNINVEIDGETIGQAGDDGWELDRDADPLTITIKGATCAALEQDGAKTVDIIYGCPTVE